MRGSEEVVMKMFEKNLHGRLLSMKFELGTKLI
mgnify:CR=1 FL=1